MAKPIPPRELVVLLALAAVFIAAVIFLRPSSFGDSDPEIVPSGTTSSD